MRTSRPAVSEFRPGSLVNSIGTHPNPEREETSGSLPPETTDTRVDGASQEADRPQVAQLGMMEGAQWFVKRLAQAGNQSKKAYRTMQ